MPRKKSNEAAENQERSVILWAKWNVSSCIAIMVGLLLLCLGVVMTEYRISNDDVVGFTGVGVTAAGLVAGLVAVLFSASKKWILPLKILYGVLLILIGSGVVIRIFVQVP